MAAAALLTACFGSRSDTNPGSAIPPASIAPPPLPDSVPDAMPRIEQRARNGNPPFYDVFGKRYFVLSSSVGYRERGVASWYGPGFHKVRTSTGETYDMYGMTAAHKTLPLPAYVRVTNLQNGRSVVVRVNDRGPFVGNRIIDLSYTAAAKLDMLRNGTAMVEVRTVESPEARPMITAANEPPFTPASPIAANGSASGGATSPSPASSVSASPGATSPGAPSPRGNAPNATQPANSGAVTFTPAVAALFVQAGAFSDPANAERLAEKLRGGSYGKVFVRDDQIAGRRMYRVRIGPVPDVAKFDNIVAALDRAGVHDAHLALD